MSRTLNLAAHTPAQPLVRRCALDEDERRRDRDRHPISRWYACPLAQAAANRLAGTRVRPAHVTLLGLAFAGLAVALLLTWPQRPEVAVLPAWLWWLCDRIDGKLARRQGTASAFGAWLDASLDELVDVALAAAMAAALARQTAAAWPWLLLAAFLAGKFLLFASIAEGRAVEDRHTGGRAQPAQPTASRPWQRWWRCAYHLPGNADVRLHVVLGCLACDRVELALGLAAAYFPLRWLGHTAKMVWRFSRAAADIRRGAA